MKHQDYSPGYHFSAGRVTSDPNLLKLLSLLANRPGLRATGFHKMDAGPEPETALEKMYAEIQAAIWSITDRNGLVRAEVNKLKNMLDAFK